MGSGRMSDDDWSRYSTTHITGKSTAGIYKSTTIIPELDPKGVKCRESCDSVDNPNSTACIVGLDVTGSMSDVLEAAAKGLGTLVTEIYNRKPITDPHLMFMGIGDAEAGDRHPLQITQFEADIRIAEQLTKIYFEQGGGGNSYESYSLAWYFAALHTKIDCFIKRRKKGYLFTIGDEQPTAVLRAEDVDRVLGYRPQLDYPPETVLTLAQRQYEVFHLIIEEGSHCRSHRDRTVSEWTALLGQRAIPVSDHTKIAEIIVSILQREAGVDTAKIASSWDGKTALAVSRAIDGLEPVKADSGAVRL